MPETFSWVVTLYHTIEPNQLSRVLNLGVVLTLAIGIGLILLAGPLQTGLGVVLVIAGLIGLMPALRYRLATDRSSGQEWGTG